MVRKVSAASVRKALEVAGGRRFLLALGAGITTSILQWFQKLDAAGSTYAMVVIATVAAYITGGTVQKQIDKTKEPTP